MSACSGIVMRRSRRGLPRRELGALAVAICTSGSGFLIATAIARESSVHETGRFAIAAAAVFLLSSVARSAVTDALIVNPSGSPDLNRIGRASVIGLGGAAVAAIAGLLLHSEFLIVGAVALHGLTIRDCVRAVLVARGSIRIAFTTEVVWLVLAAISFSATSAGVWSALTAFAVWAGSGSVLGYAVGAWQRFDMVPSWRSTPVGSGRSLAFAADTMIGSGVVQVVTWGATMTGGLTIAAALRGAGTLAGPVTIGLGAARSLLIPRAVARLGTRSGPAGLALDTGLLCLVAAPGLVALAASGMLPESIGRSLLGDTWRYVAPILPLTALELLFQLTAAVPEAAHRALGLSRRILMLRVLSAVMRIPAMVAVAPMGITAMMTVAAVVTALNAALWWGHLLHVQRGTSARRTDRR